MNKTCTKGIEVEQLTAQARTEGMTFLSNVATADVEQPFDLTFMLENPDFDNDATTGWTSTNGALGYDAKGAEFYERTFDFYQVLDMMPSGIYEWCAYAFQRPGSADNIYAQYTANKSKVTTSLYIGNADSPVCHICDDRQATALFNDGSWGSDRQMGDGTYIPNCMTGAERYFDKGFYDCSVATEVTTSGESLRLGIRCTNAPTYYWTMFDHFRLYFYGGNKTIVHIEDILQTSESESGDGCIYDLSGRRIANSKQDLPLKKGLYIQNGKKVLIR